MQFREVTEFIPGTKYRIVCNVSPCAYEGIYVSTNYLHRFKHVPTFKNLEYVNFIPDYHTYYVPIFQRHHIQSNMEHRAVNLILKNIIGDPTFSWVGAIPYNPVITVITMMGS
uniref:Uncharacterized protein n=1 Tax=viral metagenome TaxID=1070528 RepID=A0A6C0HYU4_9ZZZZ